MNTLPIQDTDSLSPYPQIEQNLAKEQQEPDYTAPWIEIGHEEYWWFLECLPPFYQDYRGFVNPSIDSYAPDGKPVRLGVIEADDKYFAKLVTLEEYTRNTNELTLQPRVLATA